MQLARFIILVHCSALGIALSMLLIGLLLRQKNADATTRIGIALAICLGGIYGRMGGSALSNYYALPHPFWIARYGTLTLITMIAFLPAMILCSWRESPILHWKPKMSIWLLAGACISALTIVLASERFGPDPLQNRTFDTMLVLNKLLCLAPAFVSILRLPLDPRLKTFMKVIGLTYLVSSSINIIWTSAPGRTSLQDLILALVVQGCILSGLLGLFIVAARFKYADVFARWSTRIVIFGLISLGGALSFIFFGVDAEPSNRSAGLLLCSLGLGILLLLGIALTERCEGWVELYVLHRFDLRVENVRLQNERVGIESKEDLFTFIETELPQRLEVREVRIVSRSCVPKELLALESAANATLELSSHNMPMQVGALSDVDLLVPIPSTGDMIGVSTGKDRQSLNRGEIGFLQDLGDSLSVRVRELEVEAAHQEHALRETVLRQQLSEAELRALRAQVNPHFLFNSLNTIADLIVRNPVKAERMTLRLSSVFRHVLVQADRQFVTLAEEFSFLRNYLGIEQERFGENLEVSFEMDPVTADAVLPSLLLQPLIENALKHGLGPKAGKRSLRIISVSFKDGVLLDVIDDGVGFPLGNAVPFSSESRSAGVGLANTRARLRAVYGDEGRLVIESAPMQGSRVSLSLPSRR